MAVAKKPQGLINAEKRVQEWAAKLAYASEFYDKACRDVAQYKGTGETLVGHPLSPTPTPSPEKTPDHTATIAAFLSKLAEPAPDPAAIVTEDVPPPVVKIETDAAAGFVRDLLSMYKPVEALADVSENTEIIALFGGYNGTELTQALVRRVSPETWQVVDLNNLMGASGDKLWDQKYMIGWRHTTELAQWLKGQELKENAFLKALYVGDVGSIDFQKNRVFIATLQLFTTKEGDLIVQSAQPSSVGGIGSKYPMEAFEVIWEGLKANLKEQGIPMPEDKLPPEQKIYMGELKHGTAK